MITWSIPVLCVCGLEEKMIKDQKEQFGGFFTAFQYKFIMLFSWTFRLFSWTDWQLAFVCAQDVLNENEYDFLILMASPNWLFWWFLLLIISKLKSGIQCSWFQLCLLGDELKLDDTILKEDTIIQTRMRTPSPEAGRLSL